MKMKWKRPIAGVLAAVVTLTAVPAAGVLAKTGKITQKNVRLSRTSVQLEKGKKVTIKVKNSAGVKMKRVTWSVTKGKAVVSLAAKSKKGVTIKAVKSGTATVQCKMKTSAGNAVRTVKVTVRKASVTDKEAVTAVPTEAVVTAAPTAAPVATAMASQTPVPVNNTAQPTQAAATATPDITATAVPTATPEDLSPVEIASEQILHYDMKKCSEDGRYLLDQSGNGFDAELVGVKSDLQENDSLLLQNGGYIRLPEKVFRERNTLTISIWLRNYSGSVNTSAMFIGTKEKMPVSYWLLNPANPEGKMKSVFTNSVNAAEPYKTEVGISASVASQGVPGPVTGMKWNHYVTVITEDSLTAYLNGEKVGTLKLNRKISDFGNDLVAYIGKSSYPDVTYTGYVRDVRVYQTAKTEEQVAAIYEESKVEDMEKTGTKSEIFIADRADPYIVKGQDGYYYFTASFPMYGAADRDGYDRIVLRRSKTLQGLKDAEEKVVWNQSESATSHRFIWAPEMHYIGGKWYLFFAASGSSNNVWDINCHVLMCKGDDPYNDGWEDKGKFQAAEGDSLSFTGFSLDMTYFECGGKSYVIWAQKVGLSNLYMAEVDPSEPWKAKTKAMLLSKPEYLWECVTIPVNEGPAVLIHDGKVIVAYSASATGPEYCIGYLYASADANLLDINSWTKQKTPALTSEDLIEEYGPGHNSFTEDENGNVVFVYHSRSQECFEGKCGYGDGDPLYDPCRSARIRTVQWDENGLPILNQ